MTDTDELFKGLRTYGTTQREMDAADTIESLQSRVKELEAQLAAAGEQEPICTVYGSDVLPSNGTFYSTVTSTERLSVGAELYTHPALSSGETGNRIAVYCTRCSADIGVCVEDVPDIEPAQVVDMWNRRAIPSAKRPTGRTIPDLTKMEHVCEWQSRVITQQKAEPSEFIRKRAQLDQEWCELRKLQSACRPKQEPVCEVDDWRSGAFIRLADYLPSGTRLYTRNEK